MPKGAGKSKLSAENMAKFEEAFDAIDADGTGSISMAELKDIMGGIFGGTGIFRGEAIDAFFAKFDTDKDGSMDKDEYFDFVYGSMLEQARQHLKFADTSGDGKISKDELSACFAQYGFSPEQAEENMAQTDDDGSGSLSVDEIFNHLLEKTDDDGSGSLSVDDIFDYLLDYLRISLRSL